jgi:DNA-binding XRE family transcriptional regulator
MDASEYKAIRESIGTPTEVARLLGVSRMTIHNRESGKPITDEAELAIRSLAASRPREEA